MITNSLQVSLAIATHEVELLAIGEACFRIAAQMTELDRLRQLAAQKKAVQPLSQSLYQGDAAGMGEITSLGEPACFSRHAGQAARPRKLRPLRGSGTRARRSSRQTRRR